MKALFEGEPDHFEAFVREFESDSTMGSWHTSYKIGVDSAVRGPKGEGWEMTIKAQLLEILEKSKEADEAFLASLSDDEKVETGRFERWTAKDNLAHASYWSDMRARQAMAFVREEDFGPAPQYEQANVVVYERYVESPWDEVLALAEQGNARMLEAVQGMDEEALNRPSAVSEGTPMWQWLLGVAFTHKLAHFCVFYEQHGHKQVVSRLWRQWAEAVSPLDAGPDWQGGVHYNAACSLALVGEVEAALDELKLGIELRPGLKGWSRLDSDLASLHDDPRYKELYAPAYWWEALESGPLHEALADQWLRTFFMLRNAIKSLPEADWLEGESLYQRPVSLALHILQSTDGYTALEPGEGSEDPLTQINWQERDTSKLPSQIAVLAYQDVVEKRMAKLLVKAELEAEERLFAWTGKTILSRIMYTLRHAQHHLADLAMELKRRGYEPPNWE